MYKPVVVMVEVQVALISEGNVISKPDLHLQVSRTRSIVSACSISISHRSGAYPKHNARMPWLYKAGTSEMRCTTLLWAVGLSKMKRPKLTLHSDVVYYCALATWSALQLSILDGQLLHAASAGREIFFLILFLFFPTWCSV